MLKRILATVLTLIMVLGMFAITGCGESTNSTNAYVVPETGFNMDEPVEITFTHTMGAKLQGVLDTYIAEFNKLYPNITITHQSAGGWGDINGQINTEIAGGTQPNIAYCYPDHVAMYNIAKSVVVLDNLIASDMKIGDTDEIIGLTDAQKADFIESYYNEGKVYGDDMMYTMPLNKSTEVLYYDKTFFDANGLKVPTSWDELWDVCKKIKEIDPDCYPLGYDAEDNWFITLCEQMETGYTSAKDGGQYLFNNDANKKFVKELREYYQKGYFTTQELYGSYTSNLFVETTDTRCYMCVGSSGGASYQMSNNDTTDGSFAFEVGVAPIPQANQNNRKVISQGPSLCILKGSNTTDQQILASWLFVKFLTTSIDFQAEFSMASGYMPVIKSAKENENYAAWLAKANGKEYLVAKCVQVGLDNEKDYFVSEAFNGSSTAREQVGSLMLKCLSAETDNVDKLINEAFEDAIAECEY
ncbi:MAG: extracellular solute-binding protein [Clostridia bacterium]|nr:extracellular solute-binding protein [Clostridia bacterium]